MGSRLKLKVTKTPEPNNLLAAKTTRVSGRMMRKIFGAAKPRHHMAVILPGRDVEGIEVEVQPTDDLMALADAVMRHPSTSTKGLSSKKCV